MRSSLSRYSVLLISNDPHLARLATWILVEAGFYAAFVTTVGEALERRDSMRPDVVALDAVGDGPVQPELLREAFPAARLVGLHSQADGLTAHVDLECHLHKPFSAEALLDCINEALAASVRARSTHSHWTQA